MECNPLRAEVYMKYGSCTKFANAIGWSQRKARDIVSGRQVPNADEIGAMANKLGIKEPKRFMEVFFYPLVHKVDDM